MKMEILWLMGHLNFRHFLTLTVMYLMSFTRLIIIHESGFSWRVCNILDIYNRITLNQLQSLCIS